MSTMPLRAAVRYPTLPPAGSVYRNLIPLDLGTANRCPRPFHDEGVARPGATPLASEKETAEAEAHVQRTAKMFGSADRHQPRPADVLLRARLSRLVREPGRAA